MTPSVDVQKLGAPLRLAVGGAAATPQGAEPGSVSAKLLEFLEYWRAKRQVRADAPSGNAPEASRVRAAEAGEPIVVSRATLQIGLPGHTPAGMVLLDRRAAIVSGDAAWRASWSRLQPDGTPDAIGMAYTEACRFAIPGLDRALLGRQLDALVAGRIQSHRQGFMAASPDGLRPRQLHIRRMRIAGAVHLVVVHEDLSDAALAEEALSRTTQQLLSAQEDERHRIAVELHDSTSQHLTAIGLCVTRLQRLMGAGQGARDVLRDMSTSLQEAVKEIRVLSYLLKPTELEHDGLEATVRRFVRGFGLRTGLDTSFVIDGAMGSLDAVTQHAAFRVVQEALANVYRHASATYAGVELTISEGVFTVRISDNGQGIEDLYSGDIERVQTGVGIAGMRSRAAQLGGMLDIASNGRGQGTVVTAILPAPLFDGDPPIALPRRRRQAGEIGRLTTQD
jgi:signal transduction histidine kinase